MRMAESLFAGGLKKIRLQRNQEQNRLETETFKPEIDRRFAKALGGCLRDRVQAKSVRCRAATPTAG